METSPIRQELLGMLATWRTGKEVRVPELGHTQRMAPHPGEADRLDFSGLVSNDQQKVYAYVFDLLEQCLEKGTIETHEEFLMVARPLAAGTGLTDGEFDGAVSLVWKALRTGWRRAIAGHKDEQYINIRRQKAEGRRQQTEGN